MIHTTLQRLTFSIHFSHHLMGHGGNFLKATWAYLTPIPQTNFSIWSNLPKTPFWQVHNFFFIHFQDNLKTCSGRPKTNLQDPHVLRAFTLTHNLGGHLSEDTQPFLHPLVKNPVLVGLYLSPQEILKQNQIMNRYTNQLAIGWYHVMGIPLKP